jgi:hypothetical protein
LEILVASVLGLMLMAALYASFDLILTQATSGRDLTSESDLSRAIINRVGLDVASPIGLLPPRSGGTAPSSGSSGSITSALDTGTEGTTGTESTTGTGTESTTTTTPTTTGTESTTSSTTTTSTTGEGSAVTGDPIPLQCGVIGTANSLSVFVSKPPKYIRERFSVYDPTILEPADVIRVTYYMHSSGIGLCRQERPWVLSDSGSASVDPDYSTEEQDIIAPEVVNLTFTYASSSGYVSDWDGSAAGLDGATYQGPPRAIRMTFVLEFPSKNGQFVQKTYSHTYPLRSAVGLLVGSTTTTDTTTTTEP